MFCFFLDLPHFDMCKEQVIPLITTTKGGVAFNEIEVIQSKLMKIKKWV